MRIRRPSPIEPRLWWLLGLAAVAWLYVTLSVEDWRWWEIVIRCVVEVVLVSEAVSLLVRHRRARAAGGPDTR